MIAVSQLKQLVADRQLLQNLQRRLNQIVKRKDQVLLQRQNEELTDAQCMNGADLSWQDALENIMEQENCAVKWAS